MNVLKCVFCILIKCARINTLTYLIYVLVMCNIFITTGINCTLKGNFSLTRTKIFHLLTCFIFIIKFFVLFFFRGDAFQNYSNKHVRYGKVSDINWTWWKFLFSSILLFHSVPFYYVILYTRVHRFEYIYRNVGLWIL